ncbi:baseplate protein [Pantoea sp. LMR881]|uniref:baseplate protein n=1 Tax=Pantoea sp. LMR881 TaxID=3014336 RepID=UPI0022AE7FE7|nr:baseplate protein [Pantoea sp. LMR881]MCZ4061165.1 baseplate protein [Pantoea sp. LMR881]MCZ4061280.1 baseplate protein [Pantoea sp. LMR881]
MHKIDGKRRAVVIATVAKGNKMKAQVRVLADWDEMGDDALPWAEYMLRLDRSFEPTKPGDLVWVEFPYGGDSRRPMIVGAAQDWAGGVPNVPSEASGVGEQYQPPDKDGAPPAPTMSPTADMVSNRDGVLIMRTATGAYSMTRTEDGTTIGFNDKGNVSIMSEGQTYVNATGPITIITAGDAKIEAGGKMSFKAAEMEFMADKINMKRAK